MPPKAQSWSTLPLAHAGHRRAAEPDLRSKTRANHASYKPITFLRVACAAVVKTRAYALRGRPGGFRAPWAACGLTDLACMRGADKRDNVSAWPIRAAGMGR